MNLQTLTQETMKKHGLTCIVEEYKLLHFQSCSKPCFFKIIGQKTHEFSENHGFKKPWFFQNHENKVTCIP